MHNNVYDGLVPCKELRPHLA